jgi:hypothetical protein
MTQLAWRQWISQLRPNAGAGKRERKKKDQQSGFSIAIAVITALVILIGLLAIVSRSSNSFLATLWQSDFRNAREGAEYGLAALIGQLNQDRSNYLLVTEWSCWQVMTAMDTNDTVVIYLAEPQANRIQGISSNTTVAQQWQILPGGSLAIDGAGAVSGTGVRYQLSEYRPPRSPSSGYTPPSTCPSEGLVTRFSNLFGGSAFLTVVAEAYRNGQLVSSYTIEEEVHVRGGPASANEGSIVLLGDPSRSTLAKGNLYNDANENGILDASDPFLNIFCVLCTPAQTAALQAGYAGAIFSGKYKTPPFPFCDKDDNGFHNGADLTYPCELPGYAVSLDNDNAGGSGANLLPKLGLAVSGGSGSGMTVNLNYCQASDVSSAKPCTATGLVKSAAVANFGSGYAIGESVSVPGSSASTASPVLLHVTSRSASLSGNYPEYPFVDSSHTSLRQECSLVNNSLGQPYIGCIASSITGDVNVRTDITQAADSTPIPVKLFVSGLIDIRGNTSLVNVAYPQSPSALQVYGLPPTSNGVQNCDDQTVGLKGVSSMKGFFMWMPRGSLIYNGNTSYAGTAWLCAFKPNNSNASRFLGSSQAQIGGTVPIGIFKYRAVGVARVNRP